jgi:hypothetical protein
MVKPYLAVDVDRAVHPYTGTLDPRPVRLLLRPVFEHPDACGKPAHHRYQDPVSDLSKRDRAAKHHAPASLASTVRSRRRAGRSTGGASRESS